MSIYPEPWRRIEASLKMWGGWSRIFSKSIETYEKENIIYRESEQGFWVEWGKVRMSEQFREEVEICVREYINLKGLDRPKDQLERVIARLLLAEKWRPNLAKVRKEMADLRRQKRLEIQALRNEGVRKIERREKWKRSKREQRKKQRMLEQKTL